MPTQETQHSLRYADILKDVDLGPNTHQIIANLDAKDRELEATSLNAASACRTRTTSQAINANTTTPIVFDKTRWDTSDGNMVLSSYATRIYAPQKGIYLISAILTVSGPATNGQGGPNIRLNGTTDIARAYGPITNGSVALDMNVSRQYKLNQSDYVEMTFWANYALTLLTYTNRSPDLALTKIRDA